MRFCYLLLLLFLAMFVTGCGHNMYFENETTGLCCRIPIGEGADIGLMVGTTKSVTATVRGNTSFTTESSQGVGLFGGDTGIAKITQFKCNTQLNEGNIVKIFSDTNISDEVKIELVRAMCFTNSAPEFKPSVLQTRSSLIGAPGADVSQVKPFNSTGLDKLVEVVPAITTPIVENTANVVTSVVENTTDLAKVTVDNATEAVTSIGDHVVTTTGNVVRIFRLLLTIFIVGSALSIFMVFKPRKKTVKQAKITSKPDEFELIDDNKGKVTLPDNPNDDRISFQTEDGQTVTVTEDSSPPKKRKFVGWLAALAVTIWLYLPASMRFKIAKRVVFALLKARKVLKKKRQKKSG